ncbi:MAG: RHS repeat-associated core domain-containing protein, partial [Verrucomicrobiota bacterium]
FGVVIRATGPMAREFNFLFSTKYYDWETKRYYYGYRFYEPEMEKWMSRDPIGIKGGMNLYGFVKNNPISQNDYLGLWTKVERKSNQPRAKVCSETGDTISSLAETLQLDATDALGVKGWLRDINGKSITSLTPNTTYTVPNLVFVDLGRNKFVPYSMEFSSLLVRLQDSLRLAAASLEDEGYYVALYDNVTSLQIKDHLRTDGIYIYMYGGHGLDGYPQVLAPGGKQNNNDTVRPGRYSPYKIRNMVLYGCSTVGKFSGLPEKTYLSDPTKTYWNLNVSSKGWVTGFFVDVSFLNIWWNDPVTIEGTVSETGNGSEFDDR